MSLYDIHAMENQRNRILIKFAYYYYVTYEFMRQSCFQGQGHFIPFNKIK